MIRARLRPVRRSKRSRDASVTIVSARFDGRETGNLMPVEARTVRACTDRRPRSAAPRRARASTPSRGYRTAHPMSSLCDCVTAVAHEMPTGATRRHRLASGTASDLPGSLADRHRSSGSTATASADADEHSALGADPTASSTPASGWIGGMSVVPYTLPSDPGARQWVELMQPAIELAKAVAGTDFVPKAMRNNPAQITAAVLYGDEVGLGPMQSLARISVIDGRPSPGRRDAARADPRRRPRAVDRGVHHHALHRRRPPPRLRPDQPRHLDQRRRQARQARREAELAVLPAADAPRPRLSGAGARGVRRRDRRPRRDGGARRRRRHRAGGGRAFTTRTGRK